MFRIDKESKRIEITRGDRKGIRLKSKTLPFSVGDKIKFSIMEKKNYDNVLFQKVFEVTEETNDFIITLTEEDTRIGPIISKALICWYEIEYNGDATLIGYDGEGAKEMIIYPEAPNKDKEV